MTDKKIRKMTIPPKQKMEHTYCVSCKKYAGNSHIDSKTINNKVKLLKQNVLSVSMINQCFLNRFTGNNIKTSAFLLLLMP